MSFAAARASNNMARGATDLPMKLKEVFQVQEAYSMPGVPQALPPSPTKSRGALTPGGGAASPTKSATSGGRSTVFKSAPRPVMTGRASPRHRDLSPAPHHYEVKGPEVTTKMARSPQYGFGGSSTGRLERGRETSPGPGAYAHDEPLGGLGKCAWPFSPKKETSRGEAIEGSSFGHGDEAGGSSPGGPRQAPRATSPRGTGAQRAVSPRNASNRVSSPGVMIRFSAFGGRRAESPGRMSDVGPGAHDQKLGTLGSMSKGYSFSSRRSVSPPRVPGPGAYDGAAPASPRGSFSRSPARPKGFANTRLPTGVGPGAYNVVEADAESRRGPQFSWGTRSEQKQPSVPGPGAYDVAAGPQPPSSPRAMSPGCSFKGFRLKSRTTQADTVGPGAYQDPRSIGNGVVGGHSFGSRREEPANPAPGPGAYAVPSSFAT